MVFAPNRREKDTIFKTTGTNRLIAGPELDNFLGTVYAQGNNILGLDFGTLQYNKNMEFRNFGNSSFLETRRGSTLIKDITNQVYGSGIFYDVTYKFVVFIDYSGDLKSYDGTTLTTIASSKNTSQNTEFFMYQLGSAETLYYCNPTDGLNKLTQSAGALVDANVFTGATAAVKSMAFSKISGRLLVAYGHKVGYSGVQATTAANTTNMETFDFGAAGNWFWVYPDTGTGIQKLIDNGQITFIFKDTGIWAFTNAEQDINSWVVDQCDADVGTRSKDTVQYARYGQIEGYIYLGSDKTLRFFNASIERNSGARPTLKGGSSKVISKNFQKLLDQIPSGKLAKCEGHYFGRYYILSIFTSEADTTDLKIIIDTEKLLPLRAGEDINQPYWWFSKDMNFTSLLRYDYDTLYGFHVDGYISKLFVDGQYYDQIPSRATTDVDFRDTVSITGLSGTFKVGETITGGTSGTTATIESDDVSSLYVDDVSGQWTTGETITGGTSSATATISSVSRYSAIDWEAYLSWHKYSNKEAQFYDGYLHWETESSKAITFTLNSFGFGESIPAYDDTINVSLKPELAGASYFNIDYFDLAYFDSSGNNQVSQNIGQEVRGNYFSFGFKSTTFDSWARVFGIESRFKISRNDVMGKNI